jgi:redox-sensitive bicupin YhaK (pirin superfamily)
MIIHPAQTRGYADHGWLKSYHTFSFADYYNPERMNFGALRVINDDSVAPGMGFGRHPHRDMEIISIPLEGELEHKDSEGNHSVIKKGEVQVMSAGTGILHSEFNPSKTKTAKFLQIWVLPKKLGVRPRYEQKAFSQEMRFNRFCSIVSPDGRDGSLIINQEAFFSLIDLERGKEIIYDKKTLNGGLYLFVIKGSGLLNGEHFQTRDGLGLKSVDKLSIQVDSDSELLIMEVPV